MKIINVIIAIILISTALLTGSVTWSKYMNSPWTRDGKVRAEVIQVSPQISGRIEEISVQDNQFVHKGDLIFSIDSSDYLIAKNQAQAELEQANFELKQAINILSRDKTLTKKGFISKEQITDEQLQVKLQTAVIEQKKANLDSANLNLKRVNIYAPEDGFITNLNQRVGNYINAGSSFVGLIEKETFYVIGYFTESKVDNIHVGDAAVITPFSGSNKYQGQVVSISSGIADQSSDQTGLLQNVQPTIPWVRLGQRIPVRIELSPETITSNTLVAGSTVSVQVTN